MDGFGDAPTEPSSSELLTDVYSYQSISDRESPKASVRSISAFELIPPNNSDVDLTKRSKTPEPRILVEKRNGLDTDLQAVQQRLLAMRNKIWFGVGDGDTCQPISWGPCGIHISESDERISNKHKKRCRRKRHKVKSDKNANKEKAKNDKREKPQLKKTQSGLKRQKAIDIEVPKEKFAVRKSHSLPEVSKKPGNATSKNDGNGHGIGTKKTTKKKKIKSGKFEKEANLVTDTNLVISRS